MSTTDNEWEDMSFDGDDGEFLGAGNDGSGSNEPADPATTEGDDTPDVPDEVNVHEPLAMSKTDDDVHYAATTSEDVQSQKKQRSPLFWFGSLAAGVLLVAVIGGALYWLTQPTVEEQAFMAQPTQSSETPQPTTHLPSEGENTTSSADTISTIPVQHDPEAIAQLFGSEGQPVPAQGTSASGQALPESEQQRTPAPQPRHTTPAPSKPPVVRERPATPARKQEPIAKHEESKKNTQQAQPPMPTTPTSTKALYVVQVFSSPSRDDADEWLQSLRERNITGGYITEQSIKGERWYRVRFGEFASHKAAESEALRLGFREPWVARIR